MSALHNHSEELKRAQLAAVTAIREACFHVETARPTGSAYYGKAEPSDFDVLVLVGEKDALGDSVTHGASDLEQLSELLTKDGWADCADLEGNTSGGDTDDESYYGTWIAARKGAYNIIITDDLVYYYRHAAASELVAATCREQNRVLPKGRVIELFRMVRDGTTEQGGHNGG